MVQTKRFGAHYVITPDGGALHHYAVEISQGVVTRYFPLNGEIERVEWLPGVIELVRNEAGDEIRNEAGGGKLWAYRLFPFDFNAMKPCDGTRRTLLR